MNFLLNKTAFVSKEIDKIYILGKIIMNSVDSIVIELIDLELKNIIQFIIWL